MKIKDRDQIDQISEIFLILLIICIIALKITDVIKLSWFWLLSPIWILFGLGIILVFIILFNFTISYIKDERKKKKSK